MVRTPNAVAVETREDAQHLAELAPKDTRSKKASWRARLDFVRIDRGAAILAFIFIQRCDRCFPSIAVAATLRL